jgi:hypothetical protein
MTDDKCEILRFIVPCLSLPLLTPVCRLAGFSFDTAPEVKGKNLSILTGRISKLTFLRFGFYASSLTFARFFPCQSCIVHGLYWKYPPDFSKLN